MEFDVVAFINGIWYSQTGMLVLLSGLGLLTLWSTGFFARLFHVIEECVHQLAAGAAGLHRHRVVASLRLHHLRRPANFTQRRACRC